MLILSIRHPLLLTSAAALVFCAAGVASTASATVISYSHDTPQSPVPFADSFTLPSFNASLGTLTGVTIGATTSATAAVDVYNSTSAAKSFSRATATIPLTVNAPDGVTLDVMGVAGPVAGTAAPGFNDYPGNATSASGSTIVPSIDFSAFIGTVPGSYTADFSPSTFTGTSAPGVFFSGSAVAGGTTTVTYTYTYTAASPGTTVSPATPFTTIPEPMSMALLGSGLLCMGLLSRRRTRS